MMPVMQAQKEQDVTSARIRLEARLPARRCFRAYEVAVTRDLFGAWVVERCYGRIGALGRAKVRSFATPEEAQAEVEACLRKRASAPSRIGVAYQVRDATGSGVWQPSEVEAWLRVLQRAGPPGAA